MRDDAAAKMEEMAATLEELKKKERITESVVQEARKRNGEIKVGREDDQQFQFLEMKTHIH